MLRCLICCLFVFVPLFVVAADVPVPDVIEFNRDVRPILSETCYACHGPDGNTREAELRLDTEAGLFGTNSQLKPVLPGKVGESELLKRITSADPEQLMPPVDSGKKLSVRDIAVLKKWVEQGARWQGHWAYLKPVRPAVPTASEPGFSRNAIDGFVLAKLNEAGLKPSREADRITLVRRLSFDLTGLPPTLEQVDQFVNDSSPDAYEKLVARLLESPHFGERMAVHWLDLVRFADTIGYHSDTPRDIAPYRDYVIRSFNENLPFDQFTIEQLAGDLLPNPGVWQKVASGYNRLLQTTEEGGAQAKEYIAKYAADRVRNVSGVWLGATMGCAECHDHKFDPITQRDFYAMAAFFADVQEAAVGRREPGMPVPSPDDERELARLDGEIAAGRKRLDAAVASLFETNPDWARELGTDATWQSLTPTEIKVQGESHLHKQDDGSYKSAGKVAAQETYLLTMEVTPNLSGLRVEALTDEELPAKGPGLAPNGNFVLTEFKVAKLGADGKPTPVKLARAVADHSQSGHDIATTIDGKDNTGWAVLPQIGQSHEAIFELVEPLKDEKYTIALEFKSQFPQHGIGRLRVSGTTVEKPASRWVPPSLRSVLTKAAEQRSDADKNQLVAFVRDQSARFQPLRDEIQKLSNDREALVKRMPASLITNAGVPRMVRMLPRGNWLDDSGEPVSPAIPAFLGTLSTDGQSASGRLVPSPPSSGERARVRGPNVPTDSPNSNPATPRTTKELSPIKAESAQQSPPHPNPLPPQRAGEGTNSRATRLDLARWMVSADNPLPARVFVNRMWKLFYGQGLSKSLEDLGSQGEWPTHPELLDWLAVEFRESGWNVKHLVQLMVTSGTYRQSSVQSPAARAVDPFNRLLSAQNRSRLDAEFIRDNALAISGLLSPRIGGESDKPYQPDGYWEFLNFPRRTWEHDKGERQYRRGMYTWWQRSFLHPSLAAFDAPSREECTADRPRSNTPQQALTLLNDPSYVEAARVFAARILKEGGDTDESRLTWAFRRAVSRPPKPEELTILQKLLAKHREEFRAQAASAEQLLLTGEASLPDSLNKPDLAAWTSIARTILNLHETITRL